MSALVAVPVISLAALAIAVAASWPVSGLLASESFGDGTLSPDALRLERMEGFALLFWGPVAAGLLMGFVALCGGSMRRTLALGGTLGWKPVLVAALVMGCTFAAEIWLASFFPHLKELFDLPTERLALGSAVLGVVVTAPVAEELLFRGFLYTAVRERWGYRAALGISSVLFAAMHFDPTGMYALLVLPSAVLFGWLRERTGGIYVPILAHAVFNTVAVAVFLVERAA